MWVTKMKSIKNVWLIWKMCSSVTLLNLVVHSPPFWWGPTAQSADSQMGRKIHHPEAEISHFQAYLLDVSQNVQNHLGQQNFEI